MDETPGFFEKPGVFVMTEADAVALLSIVANQAAPLCALNSATLGVTVTLTTLTAAAATSITTSPTATTRWIG